MLLTTRSSFRFSSSILVSLFCSWVTVGLPGPGIVVPFARSASLAVGDPVVAAVPEAVVPGGGSFTTPARVGDVWLGTFGGEIEGLASPTVPGVAGGLNAFPA